MKQFRIAVAAAVLLAGCAFALQGPDNPDEVGGTYDVTGTVALEMEDGGQLIFVP